MLRLMFALVTVMMSSQIAFAGWTELNIKEKKGNYQFTASRKLTYKKHAMLGFAVGNHIEKITISPTSPNSKYAVCFVYDEDQPILLNLKKYTASRLPLGSPIVWTSWSPKSTHAVLASYYEGDMSLFTLDLDTMTIAKVPAKLANELQEQRFDLDSLNWIELQSFKIKVTINCNPYTDEKNCVNEQRQKIIAFYQYKFSVDTLDGSSEEDSSQ